MKTKSQTLCGMRQAGWTHQMPAGPRAAQTAVVGDARTAAAGQAAGQAARAAEVTTEVVAGQQGQRQAPAAGGYYSQDQGRVPQPVAVSCM